MTALYLSLEVAWNLTPPCLACSVPCQKPLLGGGEVIQWCLVGLCRGGWKIRAVLPNISFCRLRSAKIKVLTEKVLMKFTAKMKASSPCSSLLTLRITSLGSALAGANPGASASWLSPCTIHLCSVL